MANLYIKKYFFLHFLDKSECTRHSECIMDEKCVVVSNLSSFFYKCMVPEQQEPVPMEIEEPEEYGQLGF